MNCHFILAKSSKEQTTTAFQHLCNWNDLTESNRLFSFLYWWTGLFVLLLLKKVRRRRGGPTYLKRGAYLLFIQLANEVPGVQILIGGRAAFSQEWWDIQYLEKNFSELAREQAFWGALAAGQEKEGDIARFYISRIWIAALKKLMRNADWQRWH